MIKPIFEDIREQILRFRGVCKIKHFRKGVLLASFLTPNTVVTVGKNNIFDVYFNSATPTTTWYGGLITSASFSAISAADTMASHAGWAEWVSYSESVRQTWGSGATSGGSVTNATPMTFTMNATGTLQGVFITSNNTKSGTSGTLWAGVSFGSTVSVVSSDVIKVSYTVSA